MRLYVRRLLHLISIIFFSYLLFLTASCSESTGAASINSTTQAFNGPLKGKLVVDGGFSRALFYMDLATGERFDVPNTDWDDQRTRFPNGVDQFYPTLSPYDRKLVDSEISLVVRNCYAGASVPDDCLVIQGTDGVYKEQFDLYYRIYLPQISPNKKYVAFYQKQGGIASNDDLDVYTRDGEWVYGISFDYGTAHTSRFQWLPDGRMLVPYKGFIEILKPYSAESEGARQFPSFEGYVDNLRVSLDGTKMVFSIGPRFMIMGTDGSNLRELVLSGDGVPLLSPAWSPDGKYLLLLAGLVNNTDVFAGGAGSDFRLYAVPTDTEETLVISSDDSVKSPSVIPIRRKGDNAVTYRWSKNDFYWKD